MSDRPRTLSGEPVSRLGIGCSRLGSFNNAAPAAEQEASIRLALDLGINLFDTADVYGQGDSERTLGRLLGARREDVFLVTKLGKRFSAKMRLMRPFKPLLKPLLARAGKGTAVTARRSANMAADFSPARFAAALDASLRRLGFDRVDALLLHSPGTDALQQPSLDEALAGLRASGRARFVGVSCDDGPALDAALALPSLDMVELPIDLVIAREGDPTFAAARARGVAVLAREVIVRQPALAPAEAVRSAASRSDVTAAVVGVSRTDRLRQLAAALRDARC